MRRDAVPPFVAPGIAVAGNRWAGAVSRGVSPGSGSDSLELEEVLRVLVQVHMKHTAAALPDVA